jgi:hypothetical protein
MPSIDRKKLKRLPRFDKLAIEREAIDTYRSTARYFSTTGEKDALEHDLTTLMVLRHHQVPTRLLDWPMSPYVAAFFASCEESSKDGEIWCFDYQRYVSKGDEQWKRIPETTLNGTGLGTDFRSILTMFLPDEPRNWFVCSSYEGFPRQWAQSGLYSLTPCFGCDHASAIASLLADKSFYHKYVIPAALKPDVAELLRKRHGIWRGSLFPDVAGAANTANAAIDEAISKIGRSTRPGGLPRRSTP